ncbi:MAG: hypothetical protein NC307_15235 [Roseburia sp.]|nr:hypothetical protein [Roseburia sp.]
MSANQIQPHESAGSIFKDKLENKKSETSANDFNEVMREKRKKQKCQKKEESWFDKRQKRIRAMLKAQARLAAERQGEMSRMEQKNHAKLQQAGANRLHNFLVEGTGREKRMPEDVTDQKYPGTANTYDALRKAYLLSGCGKSAGGGEKKI